MRGLYWLSLVLAVIGAINWGLVGFFDFDLVAALFGGQDATASRIVYGIVGIAGIILAATAASLAPERHRVTHGDRMAPTVR